MNEGALKIWGERLEFIESELAKTRDPMLKFSLQQEIQDIKDKIVELGGELPVPSKPAAEPAPTKPAAQPITDTSSGTDAPTDIAVIVALREEFTELFKQLPSPQPVKDDKTGTYDFLFDRPAGGAGSYRCAATFVGEMGQADAALAAERFLDRQRPRTLVMLGIAAGIDDDVKLGDVILAKSVGRYLERAKVVDFTSDTFDIRPGGDAFPCSQDLVQASQSLEFAHPEIYRQWRLTGGADQAEVPQFQELLDKGWLSEEPAYIAGMIASGPVVAAAESFVDWVKSTNRKYLGLEMESGGVLAAVYGRADPTRSLVLRGISDFGDARKKELDEIGAGGLRRIAMRNAVRLLWSLMDAGELPRAEAAAADSAGPTAPAEPSPPARPAAAAVAPPSGETTAAAPAGTPSSDQTTADEIQDFDVFLSHNKSNRAEVEKLGDLLEERGLKVLLAYWDLTPGRPEQEALEEIIRVARSAAVLVGRDGVGPWGDLPMRTCLTQFVERKLPVIPVLMPDVPSKPKLPLFLREFTWVDFRGGLTEEALDRLQWGITGVRTGRRRAAARPAASRTVVKPAPPVDRAPPTPVSECRILFLGANPKPEVLALDDEVREIEEKIRAAQLRDTLNLITKWAVRPDDLLQAFNQHRPHVVHFSGHGRSDDQIILQEPNGLPKAVSKQALVQLFTTLKDNIRLVIFNACYSRPHAEALVEIVDCAVGMNQPIGDRAGITFAASFYRALGFGRSVQEAFDQGKTALALQGIGEEETLELLTREGVDASEVVLVRPS